MLNIIPHDPEVMSRIKSPAFRDAPVEYALDLLSLLNYGEGKYYLVLDDFHFITSEKIKKSLPYVLKRFPVTVTVILLSRTGYGESAAAGLVPETVSQLDVNISLIGSEYRHHPLFLEFLRARLDYSRLDKADLNKRGRNIICKKAIFSPPRTMP